MAVGDKGGGNRWRKDWGEHHTLVTYHWGLGGTLLRQSGYAHHCSAVPISGESTGPPDPPAPFDKSPLFGSALRAVTCRRRRRWPLRTASAVPF